MARIVSRGNLSNSRFPLLSQFAGRTVVASQYDQQYIPGVNAVGQGPSPRNNPELFYCHNVMPSAYGWQSVGFRKVLPEIVVGGDGAIFIREIADLLPRGFTNITTDTPTGQKYFITLGYNNTVEYPGKNMYSRILAGGDPLATPWNKVNFDPPMTLSNSSGYTITTINGYSLITFIQSGTYAYISTSNTLKKVSLIGLADSSVNGTFASQGYLIAWKNQSIAWSSTVNPLDFVPSTVTGAGGGTIQELLGGFINKCVSTPTGFIIYGTQNSVAATFTGNINFPWAFKVIPGAGGLNSPVSAVPETVSGAHFALTTNGLQHLTTQNASGVFSDVSDFIHSGVMEDFDEGTDTFTVENLAPNFVSRKLSVILGRYLIISYAKTIPMFGLVNYTHALVIDLISNRYGKIKFSHTAVFAATPGKSILSFVKGDGSAYSLVTSLQDLTRDGVMLTGKFQFIRERFLQLNKVEVESVEQGAAFSCHDLPTLDGKNFTAPVTGYLENGVGVNRSYLFDEVALNHSLLFKGCFDITSLVIHFNTHGRE